MTITPSFAVGVDARVRSSSFSVAVRRRALQADDDEEALDVGAESDGVADSQERWRIDQDEVSARPADLPDDSRDRRLRTELVRIVERVAGGEARGACPPGRRARSRPGSGSPAVRRRARRRLSSMSVRPGFSGRSKSRCRWGLRRSASIRTTLRPTARKRDREVGSRCRLPLVVGCARDHENTRLVMGVREAEVRA